MDVVGAATTQSEYPGNPSPAADPLNLSVLGGLASLQVGTVSLPVIKPSDTDPGLLRLGNLGAISSYSSSPNVTTSVASSGLINSDGSLNIDAASSGQYGTARLDANSLLTQIIDPSLVNTLVDEAAVEIGALGSRANSTAGATTSEYMLSDLNVDLHSPLVGGW